MTTSETTSAPAFSRALRRLYSIRFAFAVIWAGLLFTTADRTGPFLTVLVIVYPLFDAGAVLRQLGTDRGPQHPRATEWINVAVSLAVAIALGFASASSIGAALAVWGVWAVASGIPQLITAIRNRPAGGQVPQMLSGGISVLAGVSFLVQGLGNGDSMKGVGGYAVLGAVFFLISALRLTFVLRRETARPTPGREGTAEA